MDPLIQRFGARPDGDLMICDDRGIAYQADMSRIVDYGRDYFNKLLSYEDKEIARKINAGRIALVKKHFGDGMVLDVGVGSGEFIKKRPNTKGYDINPAAIDWLRNNGALTGHFDKFEAYTFWDVIEHVPDPNSYFRRIEPNTWLFTCLPIFADLDKIRSSKHYRPNEHLYYWTEQGFVDWMALYRWRHVETQRFETAAGRESIVSFAFKRDLPTYHDMLAQYQKLHENFYGDSAWLHRAAILKIVQAVQPKSILDYGCGRSDLVAHFWRDGEREIARYDPAIPRFATMPEKRFDLVLCLDVMEHIPIEHVDKIFGEIKAHSRNVVFTISTKPARAKLPDGRNAHVTLLSHKEWLRWIESTFTHAYRIPTEWDHELMVRTFRV